MKKIYLLTTGEYSDYRIVGAYSSEHAARDAMMGEGFDPEKEGDPYRGARIEEYEIDRLPDRPKGRWLWSVWMQRGGDVGATSLDSSWVREGDLSTRILRDGLSARFRVWARDRDHAIKIAGDRRRQMIASGEWPEVSGDE